MRTAQDIINKMDEWMGCHEGDPIHKHIIDTYNSQKPLPQGYKVKYTDPWCAATVSAAAIECGMTDLIPTECSCNRMIKLFQQKGIWVEDDAYVPKPGDFVFYDWQDSGVGDNKGSSDHVGVVEKVDENTITADEGNKNDGVGRRVIKVNGKYIRGYGVPKYEQGNVGEPIIENGNVGEPIIEKKYGIDISNYQKDIDFSKVKQSGVDFVILRSTTKSGKPDSKFEEYYKGAKDAGLTVQGVYKLCYAMTIAEAQKEAEGVIKLLNGRKCDIWLDMENAGGQQKYNKDVIAMIITAFLTYCVNKGYDVGIYCNIDWYKNHIKDDIKKICRFWIARYGKNTGKIDEAYRPNVGEVMWQYSSKGKVPGINGNVDMDLWV